MKRGNFDIVMFTITTPIDPQADMYNLFHSSRIPSDRVRAGQNFQRIVDQCSVGVQSLCSQIVRDANGQVSTIYNTYVNVDEAKVAGIDLEEKYLALQRHSTGSLASGSTAAGNGPASRIR